MRSGPPPPTSRQQGTWYSFNAPYERLRLFSPWSITGFGLAVGLGLVLVYPQSTLEQRLSVSNPGGRPDQLTIEYLKVFLKAEPQAYRLRIELVKQLIGIGEYADARRQLALLASAADSPVRLEAAWLEYQIRQREAFAVPESSPRHPELLGKLQEQLGVLLGFPLDTDRLMTLLQNALAFGDGATAKSILARLLQSDAPIRADIAAELARQSLGLGEYATSATFYFRAMHAGGTLDAQRNYFMSALRTLQSGGLYAEAMDAADQNIGPLRSDKATLLFLTRLAQSSNKPDAAERYVKELLKLSMLERLPQSAPRLARFQSMHDFVLALGAPGRQKTQDAQDTQDVHIVRAAATQAPLIANLPFDDEIYTLGYEVFLSNGNLADARLLAQSAVRQQPASAPWRKRLAQVSEWSNEPLEATQQWLAYARLSGDEAGWDAVLRLSAGAFEQGALEAVLEHKLQSDPGNAKWLDQLLEQYENIGKPQSAIDLLVSRLRAPGGGNKVLRAREMELLVVLYTRVGADDDALAAARRLQSEFGPDAKYALMIANQLYRRGRIEEAMASLTQAAATTPADNGNFWRTYAEVAHFLGSDETAKNAYRTLLSSNLQDENDIGDLIALISDKQPLAAANLAEFGYAKKGTDVFAVQALTFRNRAGDWDGGQRFLDRIPAEQRAKLERNANFLAARAALQQARKNISGAVADMRAALALQPGDIGFRADMIWILIAARDAESLKRVLLAWAADAEINQALWGPFAAANMSLSRQPAALHWFRKSGFVQDNYLWLMSYAECLDATGQPDLAWRIRRRAWIDLRKPEVLRNADPSQLRDLRDRLASLAPLFMQADAANRVLQALLRADVGKLAEPVPVAMAPADGPALLRAMDADDRRPQGGNTLPAVADANGLLVPIAGVNAGQRPRDDARMSASVRELALSYALNQNERDLARAWLATRFAQQLDKPLWGELSLMLASDDRQGLDRLLDDLPDWLPMADRIDAARVAGRVPLAQTFAFDQLALLPHDEDLHQRLTELTTDEPPAFSSTFTKSRAYPLETQKFDVTTGFKLTPGTGLLLGLSERLQSSSDTSQLDNVPHRDSQVELTLRRRTDSGFISAGVLHRQAAESVNGARVDFSSAQTAKLTLSGGAGFRQEANESALMRVGAMRSGGEIDANYLLSRTEYTRLGLGWQQYSSQAGTTLGSGRTWNIEVGTHFRVEYPNLTLRAYASDAAFTDKGASDAQIARLAPADSDPATFRFMPVNARVYGVSIGAGTAVDKAYTRAWRPLAEFGVTYTPGIGWGHDMRAGLAGSVAGQDVLSLLVQSISATANTPQKTFELGVNYKWFY